MTSMRVAAEAVAAQINRECSFDGGVYSKYNPTAPVAAAVVVPGDPWGDFAETGFCEPEIGLDVVLVVAGTMPPSDALVWFEERVTEVIDALDADPTLGGCVDGVAVQRWSPPTEVAGPNGPLVQVVVTLSPMQVTAS